MPKIVRSARAALAAASPGSGRGRDEMIALG